MKIKFIKNHCFTNDGKEHFMDEEIEISEEEGLLCIERKGAVQVMDLEAMRMEIARQEELKRIAEDENARLEAEEKARLEAADKGKKK